MDSNPPPGRLRKGSWVLWGLTTLVLLAFAGTIHVAIVAARTSYVHLKLQLPALTVLCLGLGPYVCIVAIAAAVVGGVGIHKFGGPWVLPWSLIVTLLLLGIFAVTTSALLLPFASVRGH